LAGTPTKGKKTRSTASRLQGVGGGAKQGQKILTAVKAFFLFITFDLMQSYTQQTI
jgi:hypothetical protein